jgi:hypothetical protein
MTHQITMLPGQIVDYAHTWRCSCGQTGRGDTNPIGLAVRKAVEHVPAGEAFTLVAPAYSQQPRRIPGGDDE